MIGSDLVDHLILGSASLRHLHTTGFDTRSTDGDVNASRMGLFCHDFVRMTVEYLVIL